MLTRDSWYYCARDTPTRLPALFDRIFQKELIFKDIQYLPDSRSGGDFFPRVFRQQKTRPLIGARTWRGLVKSSVHIAMVDGGTLTAPDNAVFDPVGKKWTAENEGVAPDIEVRQAATFTFRMLRFTCCVSHVAFHMLRFTCCVSHVAKSGKIIYL